MADTSPKTIYGSWVDNHRLYMTITWGTIPLGATSVVVTCRTYFQSSYSVSDSVNSFTTTVNGTTTSESNNSISHGSSGGTTLLYTRNYTVAISQTQTKSFSIYAKFYNVEAIDPGDQVTVSGTVVLPASGVPYSHPTVTAGTYNFANVAQIFSFVTSGGNSYTIKNAVVKVYTNRTGTTVSPHTWTVLGSSITGSPTRYIPLSAANRTSILDYWDDTTKEITRIGIVVTTTAGGADRVHPTVYILPPTIDQAYSLTMPPVTRGPLDGEGTSTIDQIVSSTVSRTTTDPFYQAGVWPDGTISTKQFRWDTSPSPAWVEITSTQTLSGAVGDSSRTYSRTDATAVGVLSTRNFKSELYQGTVELEERTFLLPAADSFITLKKGETMADHKVGICTGTPTEMLHVGGNIRANLVKATGSLTLGLHVYSASGNTGSLALNTAYVIVDSADTWTAPADGTVWAIINGAIKASEGVAGQAAFLSLKLRDVGTNTDYSLIHGTGPIMAAEWDGVGGNAFYNVTAGTTYKLRVTTHHSYGTRTLYWSYVNASFVFIRS